MAKGNNGNYLQHSVEFAVGLHLARAIGHGPLHVALTHGMRPFEPCDSPINGVARRLFLRTLEAAQEPETCNEPAIVAAYRATGASLEHYPNSAELLAAVIGRNQLSGGITERDPRKHADLQASWSGSRVRPVNASWRSEISHRGVHCCPDSLQTPWLFSADPMTYRENGELDDDKLYRADLPFLAAFLNSYADSQVPGVATLFVYAVRPSVQPQFWDFVDDLAAETGADVEYLCPTHQGGNCNLAAILCFNCAASGYEQTQVREIDTWSSLSR